jgi:glycolate oxidase iron-sulfur subunit
MKPIQSPAALKLFEAAHQEANQCVQCGYCLPVCPTYLSMGKETASPRGRINLVKLAAEGKIDVRGHLAQPIDLCLGCRACEVACPVGVPYGHILESAKETIAAAEATANQQAPFSVVSNEAKNGMKSKAAEALKSIALHRLFPYPKRVRFVGNALWLYQKTGLDRLVRASGLLARLFPVMAAFEKVLPALEAPNKRPGWGAVYPAVGTKKATVAFFSGCLMDAMMHRTNRLSIELLRLAGCDVIVSPGQNCCGALHSHQGLSESAKQLATSNIEAFEQTGADWYVNNAGGCGAMLQEYSHLFRGDSKMETRAKDFSFKSKDITWLLDRYGPLPFVKTWDGVITYQDSCHLRNVQKVKDEPRKLIRSIPGGTFTETSGADQCCASGGIYNLLHYDESMNILDDKMQHVKRTNADVLVTTNPGCLLQMRHGIERAGLSGKMRALHLVEVLAEACGID